MSKEQLSTSTKEVPKHKNALEEKYKEQQVESVEEAKRVDETNVSDIKDELPQPSGWRLLVLPFTPKEKTKRWYYHCTRIFRQSTDRNKLWLCCKDGTNGLRR